MKRLRFNEVQKLRLRQSLQNASEVLREIKQRPLEGEALATMKNLEEAVQTLEALCMGD
jgi:hypothetical protein